LRVSNGVFGKVRIRYEGQTDKISGKGQLLLELPGRVSLELRDPLGRTHYIAALNGKRLVAFYPRENVAYIDLRSGSQYMKRFLGMELSFSELYEILLGSIPSGQSGLPFENWEWDTNRRLYRGKLKVSGRSVTCWVDGRKRWIEEMLIDLGKDVLQVVYQDFSSCCENGSKVSELELASAVTLTLQQSKRLVEFEWGEVRTLAEMRDADTFEIALPEGTKKINLR